jgi:hypothetical protein
MEGMRGTRSIPPGDPQASQKPASALVLSRGSASRAQRFRSGRIAIGEPPDRGSRPASGGRCRGPRSAACSRRPVRAGGEGAPKELRPVRRRRFQKPAPGHAASVERSASSIRQRTGSRTQGQGRRALDSDARLAAPLAPQSESEEALAPGAGRQTCTQPGSGRKRWRLRATQRYTASRSGRGTTISA